MIRIISGAQLHDRLGTVLKRIESALHETIVVTKYHRARFVLLSVDEYAALRGFPSAGDFAESMGMGQDNWRTEVDNVVWGLED